MLERARELRIGKRLGPAQVANVEQHEPHPRGRGHDRRCVRPAHDQRQARVGPQRARHLLDRVLAAGDAAEAVGRSPPDRRRCARLEQTFPCPKQERGQPVGDLHRAIGERQRRVRREQPDRAHRGQPRVGREAREHVARVHSVAGQQAGDEPGARQPSGHIVLEVRVQAPVPRMQLRRGAHREHGGVERVQPEPLGSCREQRVGFLRADVAGQRQRLIVGDVEPSQRVVGASVLRRDRAHRREQPRVEEREPAAGQLSRRCHGPLPRPRAPSRRPAGTPSVVH